MTPGWAACRLCCRPPRLTTLHPYPLFINQRARALWRNTCVRCNPLDMVKVNGKCIQKQSCLRMENGGFCESEDGACKLHSNGTVRQRHPPCA